jgi:2-amino-4-hydroxy-6-hydroxymethyldihydropteridine diphosphokinase
VYLGLGANLGDREASLRGAIEGLGAAGVSTVKQSPVYETEPVGVADQPWFLNMVLEAETNLSPEALLSVIHEIEASLGRTRAVRWGPRTIDIDILLFGDQMIVTDGLVVPHPALAARRFVLEPLADLAPDLALPGGGTVRGALDALPTEPSVRRVGILR